MNPTFLLVFHMSVIFVARLGFADIQLDSCSLSCSEHQNRENILLHRELIGRPGKAGIKGSRGFQGLKGHKGDRGSPGAPCACRQYDSLSRRLEAIENELAGARSLSSGWIKAGNNLWYKIIESTTNYATAKAKCESMNAKLASKGFRDGGITSEIYDELGGREAWIGLNDIQSEGVWMWGDGLRYTGRSLWNDGEPNNSNGNEDCAHVFKQGSSLKFNDVACSGNSRAFCEKNT